MNDPGENRSYAKVSTFLSLRRKQAEEALQESEERFRRAFEDAAIGMSITAPDGRLIVVNHALCTMLGYSENELTAKTFRDITHPEDLSMSDENVEAVLSGIKNAVRFNKRYLRKDGQTIWVAVNSIFIRDAKLFFYSKLRGGFITPCNY